MHRHWTNAVRRPVEPILAWMLIGILTVACVSFFVSLQAGAVLLLASLVAWWSWLNPLPAFIFLLVVSPLLPMFKVTQTFGSITLLKDTILLTCFARLVLMPALTRTLPYRRNILGLPLCVLIIWVGLAALRSDSLLLGLLRARELLLYPLAYFIAIYLPTGKKVLREVTAWVLTTFVIVAAAALYQYAFAPSSAVLRFDPARQIWIPRLSSLLGHPSVFGHYLILMGIIASSVMWTTKTVHVRIGSGLLALAALPLIYLTYSRAVWLGASATVLVLALALLYQQWSGGKKALAWNKVGLVVMTAIIAGVVLVQFTRVGVLLKSSFDTRYRSNEVRLEYVARLVAPTTNLEAIIGRGLGDVLAQNFREVELTTYDIASTSSRVVQLAKNSTLVDNQYLKTFIELGLIGLLLYAWIFIRFYRASWELSRTPPATSVGVVALGFLTAFIVQALFIDVWDIFPTNLAFWVVAGFTSAYLTPILQNKD